MEQIKKPVNGYFALILGIVSLVASIGIIIMGIANKSPGIIILSIVLFIVSIFIFSGLIIVNPNQSIVLNFFGKYVGTVKANGLFFVNPLYSKQKLSLRANNLATPTLKVNDKLGNPIEIAAVVVWQVSDTYKAAYDVDNYNTYIVNQSESALRHLAGSFAYDNIEDESAHITLRGGGDKVNEMLEEELNERLTKAGVTVVEARISHLAYSAEIAGAMLQRQQATAIVSARYKIVEGAVGMVEMALEELSKKQIVDLDEDKKAAMVSNLMVVLCSERGTQAVVNAGSLYN